jgi:hypothetical protein
MSKPKRQTPLSASKSDQSRLRILPFTHVAVNVPCDDDVIHQLANSSTADQLAASPAPTRVHRADRSQNSLRTSRWWRRRWWSLRAVPNQGWFGLLDTT